MKSPMHSALKNHMGKMKLHKPAEGSPLEEKAESKIQEAQEDKDGDSDLAPETKEPMHAGQHMQSAHPALQMHGDQELGPEHIPMLQQLIDHLSGQGHPAMSLDERAGVNAKEKMASIMARHKKV